MIDFVDDSTPQEHIDVFDQALSSLLISNNSNDLLVELENSKIIGLGIESLNNVAYSGSLLCLIQDSSIFLPLSMTWDYLDSWYYVEVDSSSTRDFHHIAFPIDSSIVQEFILRLKMMQL